MSEKQIHFSWADPEHSVRVGNDFFYIYIFLVVNIFQGPIASLGGLYQYF